MGNALVDRRVPDEQGAPLTRREGSSSRLLRSRLMCALLHLARDAHFGESLQNLHSPQSVALQALQVRHRRFPRRAVRRGFFRLLRRRWR